jgi:hypothetical protein
MADQPDKRAEAATESPESRLKAAGFVTSVGFWKEPGGERLFNTEDAIARLDAGEFPATWTVPVPTPGGAGVAEHARLVDERIREAEEARARPPEPPLLPSWAAPWAELVAELLKPIIRAEVRAALRGEARKQARGPSK